ncbi:hypothetical protein FIBSPDRAFT_925904 [Athelia psychrophila]|uniref:Uncharacterized protein n=1 Tax=Athelia psychrophila TaxID=1759441 RepID=A0A166U0N2_9AGAM|nr:hypothetical protein FIBSPDRAFT_925904 [Fibularhizoctonia sp. CBS 109695]
MIHETFNLNGRLFIVLFTTNAVNDTRRVMEGSETPDFFSQHLNAAILKISDLEQLFYARMPTTDKETRYTNFKRTEATLSALRGDIQHAQALLEGLRSMLAPNEVEVHCSNPRHVYELAVKEDRINELSAQLWMKDGAEAKYLDITSRSQVTREVCKCKSADSDSPSSKEDIRGFTGAGGSVFCDAFEDTVSLAQLRNIIARFKKVEIKGVKKKQNVSFTGDSQVLRILIVDSPVWQDLHAWIPQRQAGDEWIPDPQFAKVHGQVGELFFRSAERNLVYAGSYRAVVLPSIQPKQFSQLTVKAKECFVNSVKTYEGYDRLGQVGTIKPLIESGVIGIECLGLQFLAFNKDIHGGLVEAHNLPSSEAFPLNEAIRAKRSLAQNISTLDYGPAECERESKKRKTGHPLQELETPPDTAKEGELQEPDFQIFKSECDG